MCDIVLDSRYIYASNFHGEIFSDGSRMVYHDSSSNGTIVNRSMVRRRVVPLKRGDVILVAARYLLDWNELDRYLRQPPTMFARRMDATVLQPALQQDTGTAKGWNWGAMGLYPFWGLTNGCPWAVAVALLAGVLFPLPNLVFGFFGSRWAFRGRYWSSLQDFYYEQRQWKTAGMMAMAVLSLLYVAWVAILFTVS